MTEPNRIDGPLTDRQLAALDALLSDRAQAWWDNFYVNRAKPVPFFANAPDECLHSWVTGGVLNTRGEARAALDLGCGNGRNAVFLAQAGYAVDAVDYAQTAVDWAAQHARQAGVSIQLHHRSVFDLDIKPGAYDLVYDSGCFHHLAPHRRAGYVQRVAAALKPGGWLGMTCFRPEGGSGLTDDEVYERQTLGGGLGYTEERLRAIWSGPFVVHQFRQMQHREAPSGVFGRDFLWVMLAQRVSASA